MSVKSLEGTKSVSTEEDAVGGIQGCHRFRPVHHRHLDKRKVVFAGAEGIASAYRDTFFAMIVELCHEVEAFFRRNNGGFRVTQNDFLECRRMVRLPVIDDDVVQRTSIQDMVQVVQEIRCKFEIDRIKQHCFFIQQDIGVVTYAFRNRMNSLKNIGTVIVHTDPIQIFYDFTNICHANPPSPFSMCFSLLCGFNTRFFSCYCSIEMKPLFGSPHFGHR